MMEVLDITNALQSILLHHTRGYSLWVSMHVPAEKLASLDAKWALALGTREPGWKRQDRKQRNIPNAAAVAGKVFSQPGQAEIILLATENARKVDPKGPYGSFLREKWRDDLPRFSHFEMVHQPTEATGKLTWTWRIRKTEMGQIEKRLIALCDAREIETLKREAHSLVRSFPMYNGIRSQVRRMLRHVERKCAVCSIPYPGPDPENLPAMLRFPNTRKRGGGVENALPTPLAPYAVGGAQPTP